MQVERQTGVKPKELVGPPFPQLLAHLWSAFSSLNAGRTLGRNGPEPLTYNTIHSWVSLMGVPLSPRDVEVLQRLDRIYLRT